MDYYKIAGLIIGISGLSYDYFHYRLKQYRYEGSGEPDVILHYEESKEIPTPIGDKVGNVGFRIYLRDGSDFVNYDTLKEQNKNTALVRSNFLWSEIKASLWDVEPLGGASFSLRSFNLVGEVLKYAMLKHHGFVIHSSSIAYKNSGVLFSAPSGTGKSTHTRLWQKVYGDHVRMINDDMPFLRKIQDEWHLCGAPWSGKTEINRNEQVPLKAVVFLERGEENKIKKIEVPETVFRILSQTAVPVYKEMVDLLMNHIEDLVACVPVYLLSCTISEEAPNLVAETIGLE